MRDSFHPATSAATVRRGAARFRAFTLVEILIVVVILGILAAIAVPKLSNASSVARQNTLKEDIRFLRTQITVYAPNHHDTFPGFPGGDTSQTPTAATFVQQMTEYTDDMGNVSTTASPTYVFGPYLSQMPENPVNGMTTIEIVPADSTLTADGSTGWLYQPSTGAILPNITGTDMDGNPYTGY